MTIYSALIAEITHYDEPTALVIEEVMRIEHPTLDHLTRAEFGNLAQTAYLAAVELAREGLLESICESPRIEVPPLLKTCDDCQAGPGENCCSWSCSSNWK